MHKNVGRSIFVTLILAALIISTAGMMPASADTVGGNVFLQGDYLELGIRPNGSFGSTVPAPDGFHANMYNGTLGFVVDYQKDGWYSGTPSMGGDYFMPGTPWEGFGVSCGDAETAQNGVPDGYPWQNDIVADSLVENSITSATWIGHVDICGTTLQITHEIHFNSGDTYVTIDTTIENIGEGTVNGLAFGRGTDPDQTWPWTNEYDTVNTVLYQPGFYGNVDTAVVQGSSITFPDMKLILGTVDERAKANAELYSFDIYNSDTLTSPIMGPHWGDSAMQIAYDLGTLAPTEETSMTYWYGFNSSDLNDLAPHPLAVDDAYHINTDDSLSGNVLDNDFEPSFSPCAYVIEGPNNADVFNFYGYGPFDYTPNSGFQGIDSFTYYFEPYCNFTQGTAADSSAANGLSASNVATVFIYVNDDMTANPNWHMMMSYDTVEDNAFLNDEYTNLDYGVMLDGPDYADAFGFNNYSGDFMYKPHLTFGGVDAFWYWLYDGVEVSNMTYEAFEVFPPLEESAIEINYNGWQGYENRSASNGTYRGNNEKGGTFVFAPNYKFKGFTLFTYRGPDQGNMAVYLDGKLMKTVNLYRATPQWGYTIPLTFLNGKHTLRFENMGFPKGKFVRMDKAAVNTNTGKFTLEDTSPYITWGVDLWKTYFNENAMEGSYRKSTLNKARVQHDFYGERIDWITMTGPNLGIARVIIDGSVVGLIDLYSPTEEWQVIKTYDGLSENFHRIRIEATGTHSSGSTGNAIVVDAFGSYTYFGSCPVLADVKDATFCVARTNALPAFHMQAAPASKQ